jgi:xanthine/uracil/vitamin C permease (AzgA family)
MKEKSILRNELLAGILLFFISFASIQIVANLLTSGYETNQSNIIRPILLFLLPLLAGLFTMASGYFFKLPFIILPNMMMVILTVIYGRLYLGYSLVNVFLSILIGTILYFIFSMFIRDKNWKHWIPEPFINAFPFIMGSILVFFGLFRSGILAAVNSNQVATTLGDSITMVESQIPVFLGYLWNPLTLLIFLGICLYLFFQKQYPKYSLLIAYIIISLIGLLVPMQWSGMMVKGKITAFKSFGFLTFRKEGFLLLLSSLKSINSTVIKNYFTILSQSLGLLKLSFLVFITLTFQNLFVIHSLDKISNEKQKTDIPYQKLTRMNAFSTLIGVFSNLTSFSYAPESSILSLTNAKTGLTAIFCGALLIISALLAPLGIYSSQAGTPLLFIIVGCSLVFSQYKNLHFDKVADWFPGFLFVLISIITMNPVEGLVVGIIFYGLITVLDNFFSAKETVKIHPAFWISFGLCILFIISQIKIEL